MNLLLSFFAVIISIVGATVTWVAFLNDNMNWWTFGIYFSSIVIPGIINDMYEDNLRTKYEYPNRKKEIIFEGITYKKNTIVITKYRRPFHFIDDFINLKLKLSEYNILVVKSGYLSPDLNKLKVKSFMLLTDGVVNQDIKNLENHNRKRPTYPFQSVDNLKI